MQQLIKSINLASHFCKSVICILKAHPAVFYLLEVTLLFSSSTLLSVDYIAPVSAYFNHLCVNPTKWSNTLKQFVGNLPTNSLSVFAQYVELALLKVDASFRSFTQITPPILLARSFIAYSTNLNPSTFAYFHPCLLWMWEFDSYSAIFTVQLVKTKSII